MNKNENEYHIKKGDSIQIEFQSIPSSGYIWDITIDPQNIVSVSIESEEMNLVGESEGIGQPHVYGATETKRYTVFAKSKGTCRIFASYRRPWLTDPPVKQHYAATIYIAGT